jgi:DNA modification methylase/ParB-like chromosome segregation protein Spo0J
MITHTIPLDSVQVPEGRFRAANQERVQELIQSFIRFGQLQPIIVDLREDGAAILVDGLHRLEAARGSKWNTIGAVLASDTDELFLKEVELEVNIQRQEMTWQERQKAVAALHRLKVARDPNWSQDQTAAVAGARGQAEISEAIILDKMMEMFPEISGAKNKNQALSWARTKAQNIKRVADIAKTPADYSHIESKIVLGDSVEVIKTIDDDFIDAVITDPPFGIDYDSRTAGTEGSLTSYEDDTQKYERLLTMAPDLYRVIKPDGWLIWFCGISWYNTCRDLFRKVGFTVDEVPIIWDRSSGRTFTNRPDRYFTKGYDIALHCFKGEPRLVVQGKPNVISIPPVEQGEKTLQVERPVELYEELIVRLTHPNQLVADFFVGSGSCLAAAARLNRDFYGVEKSEERRAVALMKVRANLPEKK